MKILRLPRVLDKTGDSRSGLYLKISQGKFPRPIKLSTRSVGWIDIEVEQWLEQRVEATRGEQREQI